VTARPLPNEPAMFDVPGEPPASAGLSADARRTAQRRNLLAAGMHPATRVALLPGRTCAECAHVRVAVHVRRYYKCELAGLTHGPATDIRLSWPACVRFTVRRER